MGSLEACPDAGQLVGPRKRGADTHDLKRSPTRRRILLADEHSNRGRSPSFAAERELRRSRGGSRWRAVLAEATKLKPDIIVLDVDMPLLNGLDAGKRTSTGNDDSQEITG